ncbi:MAG: chemotaxis protein CheW [Pseudomonadales bacterium]
MSEDSILSALVALQDRQLLVPDNLLVDVTPLGGLIVESHKEGWILGHKYWRNMRIPVVCFENLSGGSLKKHSEKACIVILNRSSEYEGQNFWGLLVQDEPHRMTLREEDIEAVSAQLSQSEIAAVRVHGKEASVPNLVFVEEQLQASELTQ